MPRYGTGSLGPKGNTRPGQWDDTTGGGAVGLAKLPYFMDFVTDTYRGGVQPYGNNNNDGRFFRDSGVSNACFIPKADGSLQATTALGMRRSTKGTPGFVNIGTLGLWNRDMTQTAWVKANMTAAKNQVGKDGTANASTLLTATADNATCLQATVSASNARQLRPFIKRVTGTGSVFLTFDGDTTRTDITSLLVNGTYIQCPAAQAGVTDPNFGIKLGTNGDQVAVDFMNVTGQIASLNIDPMHYPTIVGSAFGSIFHETPWAINTDAGPLSAIIKADYGFYWQGYNYVPDAGGLFVSDGVTNCKLLAGNNVQFSASVNLNTTAGEWRPNASNKVAGHLTLAGDMALCVNGGAVYKRTGGILSPSATHFVYCNNGAATLALNGWGEQFGLGAAVTFSDAEYQAMTT